MSAAAALQVRYDLACRRVLELVRDPARTRAEVDQAEHEREAAGIRPDCVFPAEDDWDDEAAASEREAERRTLWADQRY